MLSTPSTAPSEQAIAITDASPQRKRRRLLRLVSVFLIAAGLLALKLKGLLFLSFAKFKLLFVNPFEGFGVAQLAVTGGSMIVSIVAYAWKLKLPFAIGIILMIFIHELGHAIVIRAKGLRAGAMVFIPFIGGAVTLRDQPRTAYDDAQIGLAGPIFGTIAAALLLVVFRWTEDPFFLILANAGFLLNLLNLCPIGVLDGGRIAAAITKWMWIFGGAVLVWMFLRYRNPLMVVILLLAAFQVYKAVTEDRESSFYDVSVMQRAGVAALYFSLLLFLGYQTIVTHSRIQALFASGY